MITPSTVRWSEPQPWARLRSFRSQLGGGRACRRWVANRPPASPYVCMRSSPAGELPRSSVMRVAFVGRGYVAEFYHDTIGNHPNLELISVHDRNPIARRRLLAIVEPRPTHAGSPACRSLRRVRGQPIQPLRMSRACLRALGTSTRRSRSRPTASGRRGRQLAHELGLQVSSVHCSPLGGCARTLWKALREQRIGRVRLGTQKWTMA